MTQSKIIWTTLPNGVRRNNQNGPWMVRLSVFATPRLSPASAEGGRLDEFPAWRDWPATLRDMTSAEVLFNVQVSDDGSGPRAPVQVSAVGLPASDAWQALLPPTTRVQAIGGSSPGLKTSQGKTELVTYSSAGLTAEIRNAYTATLLRDANLRRGAGSKTGGDPLSAFKRLDGGGRTVNASLVSQFMAFHQSLDRKSAPLPDDDLLTSDPDFHQKISALSAHPALMRELGLIIDLDIPLEMLSLPNTPRDLRLRVTPNSLPAGIETHSFWTAAEYATAASEHYRVFCPKDREQPSYGFYALNQQAMTLAQEQFEHATVALLQHTRGARSDAPLPRLLQGGMRMLDPQIPAQLRGAMRNGAELEESLSAPLKASADGKPVDEQTLYADQLTRGYRIDVVDGDAPVWRSLCERSNRYRVGDWSLPAGDGRIHDEGSVEFTAFRNHLALTPDMHVIEDLFNWDGWSLVVPRPTGAADAGPPPGCDDDGSLQIDLRVHPGSLQPQRFGRCYQFRARRVDIAGNSLTRDEAAELDGQLPMAQLATPRTRCLRVESVLPPVVFPTRTSVAGEDGDVLVIRDAEDSRYRTDRCQAHLFPPQISIEMAERHGMFDGLDAEQSWQLIAAHRNGLDEVDDDDGLPMIPAGFASKPYLPDPLVRQAVLTLPDGSAPIPLPRFDAVAAGKAPALARSCVLTLRPGRNDIRHEVRGHEITLNLPVGRAQKLRVASRLDGAELEVMAMLQPEWCGDDAGVGELSAELQAAAANGQLELLAPARVIDVVHASQRPLTVPVFDAPRLLQRRRDETVAVLIDDGLHFDVQSTGRLDVYAAWEDTVDELGTAGWVTRISDLHAGGADIGDDDLEPFVGVGSAAGSRPPLTHDFGDTKHHAVRYRAHALSRFIDLYPAELTSDADNVNRISAAVLLHVPSSAPPAVPAVAHVLPTFRHGIEKRGSSALEASQDGDGLRIYLRRGWFSSGDGEQLALVLATDALSEERRDEASDWGVNALRDVAGLPGPLRSEHVASGVLLEDSAAIAGDGLALRVHDVQFSREHQLPFVDIEFVPSMTFMPLVSLVLARYQPFAIEDCHLSPTMRTDFVPLAPGRTLNIEKTASAAWSLSVRGSSYRQADGKQQGKTSAMLARIEVLSVDSPVDDAVWMVAGETVTLEVARLAAYEYGWHGNVAIDEARWPGRRWRRRLVVTEFEVFPVEGVDESPLADHSRLVSAHTVGL